MTRSQRIAMYNILQRIEREDVRGLLKRMGYNDYDTNRQLEETYEAFQAAQRLFLRDND